MSGRRGCHAHAKKLLQIMCERVNLARYSICGCGGRAVSGVSGVTVVLEYLTLPYLTLPVPVDAV